MKKALDLEFKPGDELWAKTTDMPGYYYLGFRRRNGDKIENIWPTMCLCGTRDRPRAFARSHAGFHVSHQKVTVSKEGVLSHIFLLTEQIA